MKKSTLTLFCLILAGTMCSASGCRFSSVIEQVVLDKVRAEETLPEEIPDNEETAEEKNEDLPDLDEDESAEEEESFKIADAVYSDDVDVDRGEGSVAVYNDQDAKTDEKAAKGNSKDDDAKEKGDKKDKSDKDGDKGESGKEKETEKESKSDGSKSDNTKTDDDKKGDQGEQGGEKTHKTIYGDNGEEQEVPENVYGVAAVGDAAIAVMMLGGTDCLVATNESLLSGSIAQNVFGSVSAEALWPGDGSEGISDANLDALLNLGSKKPDVVFETSGDNTLTESQVAMLEEAGVYVVTIPKITNCAKAKSAASIIAQVLGDGSNTNGINAIDRANAYSSWIDNNVRILNEKYYTLYVDGWDSSASYNIGAGTFTGYGAAIIQLYKDFSLNVASGFLNDVNIQNCTTDSLVESTKTGKYIYAPFGQGDCELYSSLYDQTNAGILDVVYNGQENIDEELDEANVYRVGGQYFPYIIVGDNETKNNIEINQAWVHYDYCISEKSHLAAFGFVGNDGKLKSSMIHGYPTYVVNPCGVSMWTDSSLESVLESVWAGYLMEGNAQGCASQIKDFYSTFYNYNLSDSEVNSILAGK